MTTITVNTTAESTLDFDRPELTVMHVAIVIVASVGFAFDVLEVALGNVLSTVFSSGDNPVDAQRLSWLLAAMYIGAIFGAPLSGILADRYGKKTVLACVLVLMGATSAGAAISPDINWLIGFRLLSGLAIGAYPPLVIAYLTDVLPPAKRGMLIMLVSACAALGPVGVIFLVRWLEPIQPLGIDAWRWAFWVGAFGSLVAAFAFARLPESPRWLFSSGHVDKARSVLTRLNGSMIERPRLDAPEKATSPVGISDLPTTALVPISLLSFLSPWSSVAFPVLMGAILVEKGFELSDALFYVGVSTAGPILGTVITGLFLDRLDRRVAVATWATAMVVAGVTFVASWDAVILMTSGVIFYTFAALQPPTLSIYAAESFPTAKRATMSTIIWGINRIASAAGLLMLVPLLRGLGVWPIAAVIVGTLVTMIGVVLAFGPAGRSRQPVG